MKTIYFHVGLPKTASTFLQYALSTNVRQFAKRGYAYPRSPLEYDGTQRLFCFTFITQKYPGILNRDFFRLDAGLLHGSYQRIIAREGADNFIFSSERLSSHLSNTDFEAFARFFHPHDVKIIILLRRQDLLLEALYRESVRSFNVGVSDIWDFYERYFDKDDLHFDKLLDRWASIVGPENIRPIVFESEQLPNGVLAAFIEALGLKWEDMAKDLDIPDGPIERNLRLSGDEVEFLRRLKQRDLPEALRKRIQGVLSRRANTDPLTRTASDIYLSRAQRVEFLARFRDSNANVARRYFDFPSDQLFMGSPASEPEPLTSRYTDEDMVRVGANVLSEMMGRTRSGNNRHDRLGARLRFFLYGILWPAG